MIVWCQIGERTLNCNSRAVCRCIKVVMIVNYLITLQRHWYKQRTSVGQLVVVITDSFLWAN